jgi:hypothetical protein
MNLTQLERMKTELKRAKYGENKIEKDLFAINYRFQGVAEKIPETHWTVLVKLVKLGVRSTKALWLDLVESI